LIGGGEFFIGIALQSKIVLFNGVNELFQVGVTSLNEGVNGSACLPQAQTQAHGTYGT
jgi:hypothetical protein